MGSQEPSAAAPRKRSAGLGPWGPQAGASTSGARAAGAQGPAPINDVIVVGAGIVGAACAAACARRGLRVLVLDGAGIGGGATAAGMGHLVVMDDSEAQFSLTRYSQQLWQQLEPELPPDVEYTPSGTIWVAADEEEMAEVRHKHAFYGARGVATEILDAASLARLEPNLRPGLAGGLLVPGDAVIYPPCAARFLLQRAAGAPGIEVRLGARVVAIGQGRVRLADGAEYAAGVVVNAAGAAAVVLSPGLPIRGRKGHLVITDRYPGWVRHQLVELGYLKSAHAHDADSVAFNVQPRATGQVLIGSSRQFHAADGAVDHAMLARMLRRAQEYMPSLAALSALRTWTGFRAATPDSLPLIGLSPDDPTVFLATGHEGLGITTSLGTGQLVADQIVGEQTAIPAQPYFPNRFNRSDGLPDAPHH
ncbi:MAG TPA: FAD-dependent oxidoreductase [Terriglobales bacterium]|nr:FAD-dependent oxidoreductase [Terriglobales bacterium]